MLPWQPNIFSASVICYHGNQIHRQQVKYVTMATIPWQPNTTSAGRMNHVTQIKKLLALVR